MQAAALGIALTLSLLVMSKSAPLSTVPPPFAADDENIVSNHCAAVAYGLIDRGSWVEHRVTYRCLERGQTICSETWLEVPYHVGRLGRRVDCEVVK